MSTIASVMLPPDASCENFALVSANTSRASIEQRPRVSVGGGGRLAGPAANAARGAVLLQSTAAAASNPGVEEEGG